MVFSLIQDQIKDAMRAKDAQRLETLRYVLSQLKYAQIEKRNDLTDDESLSVLSKEVKKRRDAIELFQKSGRLELVKEEEEKLAVITALLPEQMSTQEIEQIVRSVIAREAGAQMGLIIKTVMQETKGRADGKIVSQIVQTALKQ